MYFIYGYTDLAFQFFPLVMESLQNLSNETNVTLSSLEAVYSLMNQVPDVIGEHVTSLIPCLLKLAKISPKMVRTHAQQSYNYCLLCRKSGC